MIVLTNPPMTQGCARLEAAREQALNIMLARTLSFRGLPLYRLSWAMDDWNPQAPLCLENQASYHLLVRELPSMELDRLERSLGVERMEKQVKGDFSQGAWACQLHFIDPLTGRPFDPTASIIERIIPILRAAREANFAAQVGDRAVLQRMRERRQEAMRAQEEREHRDYMTKATAMLDEVKSGFGGAAWSGGHGPKTRHSSEIVLTDAD